jgi:hypothetical protein
MNVTMTDHCHNRSPSSMPQLHTFGKKASKRRITFATTVSEVVGRVLSRDDFSEAEKAEYWIERKEFAQIRSNANVVVAAVKEHGQAYVDFIEDSYRIAQHLSEFMVDDDESDLFFEDPSTYTKKMVIWTEADYGQRGLEKYIASRMGSHRVTESREARLVVVTAASMDLNDDDLANLSEALSWTASIYARMLGHSDSIAAGYTKISPVLPVPMQMSALKGEPHLESVTLNQKLKVPETQGLTRSTSKDQVLRVSRAA